MPALDTGLLLDGPEDVLKNCLSAWKDTPVDWDLSDEAPSPVREKQTTIAREISVTGPGTFHGKSPRTLTLRPSEKPGWRFDRLDLADCLPVRVSPETVWTTGDIVSNIVLRSGPPHNYIRMVEHIIALKLGSTVDNLIVGIDSGDPPLFERGSLDLVEALDQAGVVEQDRPVRYITVKEPVSIAHPSGRILVVEPCEPDRIALDIDCALEFPTAIGKQRIKFTMNDTAYRRGAEARTNTSRSKMLFCKTIGKLFADIRNLGYTHDNILIAGKDAYVNEPRLLHEGKSLEAVWHRSVLDLVAALALVEEGRFVGKVTSYKAGHRLDVELIRHLYQRDLLVAL